MRTVVCGCFIKDRRILLIRSNKVWILPGGKPEGNETELDCLKREVNEEIDGVEVFRYKYLGDFKGVTPNTGDTRKFATYLVYFDSNGEVAPKAEIVETAWAGIDDLWSYELSDSTQKIMNALVQEGLL